MNKVKSGDDEEKDDSKTDAEISHLRTIIENNINDQNKLDNEQSGQIRSDDHTVVISESTTTLDRIDPSELEKVVLRKEKKETLNLLTRRPAFRDASSSSKKISPLLEVDARLVMENELQEHHLWHEAHTDDDNTAVNLASESDQPFHYVHKILRDNGYNPNTSTHWGKSDSRRQSLDTINLGQSPPMGRMRSLSTVSYVGDDCKLLVEGVTASWNQDICLEDISFSVYGNELCIVVGSIGCGKTSLLMALMGEIPLEDGQIM